MYNKYKRDDMETIFTAKDFWSKTLFMRHLASLGHLVLKLVQNWMVNENTASYYIIYLMCIE